MIFMIMIIMTDVIIKTMIMNSALQWSGGGFSKSGSSAKKDERRVQARYHDHINSTIIIININITITITNTMFIIISLVMIIEPHISCIIAVMIIPSHFHSHSFTVSLFHTFPQTHFHMNWSVWMGLGQFWLVWVSVGQSWSVLVSLSQSWSVLASLSQ